MYTRTYLAECPPEGQLRRFLTEDLPPSKIAELEEHLDHCERCQDAMEDLTLSGPRTRSMYVREFTPAAEFLDELRERVATARVEQADPLPDVPGYYVFRELGRGGSGIVYLARHLRLNRFVALKLLRTEVGSGGRERFRREAEAIARVQHPNVIQIFEVGDTGGRTFLALEYVDGPTLAEAFAGAPQPPRRAAQLIEAISRAVAAAHARGVVHRDLKPGNVLLAAEDTPKVTDFGLAKLAGDGGVRTTCEGQFLGTPNYAAPEQVSPWGSAEGGSDVAVDVYAVGTILYEALTGRPPFQAPDAFETLLRVLHCDPVPPSRLQPNVPRDLETICLTCLAKNPARRYADAEALANDLRCFLEGRPIAARAAGRWERLARWARRNPAAAGLAALVCFAPFAIAGTSGWLLRQAEIRAEIEADARRAVELRAADLAVDRALTQCEYGEVPLGLSGLEDAVAAIPAGGESLARAARFNRNAWSHYRCVRRCAIEQEAEVASVAFSPDGDLLATLDRAGVVRLWDPQNGRRLGVIEHPGGAASMAFRPSGGAELATSGTDGTAQRWKLPTGTVAGNALKHGGSGRLLAFSEDASLLVTDGRDNTAIVWKLDEPTPEGKVLPHGGPVLTATFRPDGKRLLSGSDDGKIRVWDTHSGKVVAGVNYEGAVTCVAFSPDGQQFACGGPSGMVWRWRDGGPMGGQSTKYRVPVSFLAYDPRGAYVAMGGGVAEHNFGVTLFWPHAGRLVAKIVKSDGQLTGMAVRSDGRAVLAAGGGGRATLWLDPLEWENPVPIYLEHTSAVGSVAFSPNGRLLATTSNPGSGRPKASLILWDAPPDPSGPLVFDQSGVDFLSVGPDGKVFAAGPSTARSLQIDAGEESPVAARARLWNADTGKPSAKEWSCPKGPKAVCWQGRPTLYAAEGKLFHAFDPSDGKAVRPPVAVPGNIVAVAASPAGDVVAAADDRPGLQLLDAKTGAILVQLPSSEARIAALAFSSDGSLLSAGGADGFVHTWTVSTREPAGQPIRHRAAIEGVAFAPNSTTLAVACADKTVRVWEPVSGRAPLPPMVHPDGVARVAWSPDGTFLVGGCRDGTTRLWDAATGKPVGPPLHCKSLAVTFSADGKYLLTGNRTFGVRSWRVPSSE